MGILYSTLWVVDLEFMSGRSSIHGVFGTVCSWGRKHVRLRPASLLRSPEWPQQTEGRPTGATGLTVFGKTHPHRVNWFIVICFMPKGLGDPWYQPRATWFLDGSIVRYVSSLKCCWLFSGFRVLSGLDVVGQHPELVETKFAWQSHIFSGFESEWGFLYSLGAV